MPFLLYPYIVYTQGRFGRFFATKFRRKSSMNRKYIIFQLNSPYDMKSEREYIWQQGKLVP